MAISALSTAVCVVGGFETGVLTDEERLEALQRGDEAARQAALAEPKAAGKKDGGADDVAALLAATLAVCDGLVDPSEAPESAVDLTSQPDAEGESDGAQIVIPAVELADAGFDAPSAPCDDGCKISCSCHLDRAVRSEAMLRFKVGTRVECRCENDEFLAGTVVALWYSLEEEGLDKDSYAPYQVLLDVGPSVGEGEAIWVPADNDMLIRKMPRTRRRGGTRIKAKKVARDRLMRA